MTLSYCSLTSMQCDKSGRSEQPYAETRAEDAQTFTYLT
jgi:hypothetical protein